MGRTGCGIPVRHLRAIVWREVADGDRVKRCYEENAKMVVDVTVWPAFSSVDGKLGWLGEFGKCWVSNV
jgi:hypothetical protein